MGRTVFYEGRFVRKVLLCNGHEGTLLDGRIIRGSIPACGVRCRTGEERRLLRIVSWNCNGEIYSTSVSAVLMIGLRTVTICRFG